MSEIMSDINDEKFIELYPNPVTISGTTTILEQMKKSICKIYKAKGTGFFCIIPNNKNINDNLKLLITNYHIIDDNYIKNNKLIKITLNDDKEDVDILLNVDRKIYLNQKYDIAIIQIKENDNLNCNYLELDDNIFKNNSEILYSMESVYILQYPEIDKASVSYGIIKDILNHKIIHLCNTKPGSSGSPILNIKNNKLIGIHKGSPKKDFKNYNIGIFLKNAFIDFINNYCNKEKKIFDINSSNKINESINNKDFNKKSSDFNNYNYNLNISNFKNNDINPLDIQQKIYNKLLSKDFSSPPNYINGLNINNSNISQNNKLFLQKLSEITKYFLITPLEILYKEQYTFSIKKVKEKNVCPKCLNPFYQDIIPKGIQDLKIYISHEIDTIKLSQCKEDHFYHIKCLFSFINGKTSFKCLNCKKVYRKIVKNKMPEGTMKAKLNQKLECPGYPNIGTITIEYIFKDGNIDGIKYFGTIRYAFLPNNKEGREILGMLKIAFDRKLTFVIGTSYTSGKENSIIWNGIHHKTNIMGGNENYGFPDSTYFNKVKEDLASKGIVKEDYHNNELESIAYDLINNYK